MYLAIRVKASVKKQSFLLQYSMFVQSPEGTAHGYVGLSASNKLTGKVPHKSAQDCSLVQIQRR